MHGIRHRFPTNTAAIVKDIAVAGRAKTPSCNGIESATDRLNTGKPTQGQLKLIFQELGGHGLQAHRRR